MHGRHTENGFCKKLGFHTADAVTIEPRDAAHPQIACETAHDLRKRLFFVRARFGGKRERTHGFLRELRARFQYPQKDIRSQYIDELGKLVERQLAQPLAHASDARIRGDLEHWAAFLVKLPELGEPVLGIHAHAAELVHVEFFAILTNALLLEKDGALGIVDFDGDGHDYDNQLKDTRTKALKTMSNARFVKR